MGDARRRKIIGKPRFQPKPQPPEPSLPLRSPVQVEEESRLHEKQMAIIAASIDFIHQASEHALRQQTRRMLAVRSQP